MLSVSSFRWTTFFRIRPSQSSQQHPGFKWFLLLSVVTTVLFLSDDYILRWLGGPDHAELELGYVSALWAFNLCCWLSGRRWLVNLCLLLLSFMQLIQLAKMDHSGTPLHPYDIANLFRNQADVAAVLWHELPQRWDMLLAWVIPYGSLFFLFNRFMPRYRQLSHRLWSLIAAVLMVYAIIARPISALDHHMIDFMPGPTRSSLHNSLAAFGYYIAKMAFNDNYQVPSRPEFEPYHVTTAATADKPDNIIVVISDTLRYDHLGIAGYSRHTTPHLAKLKAADKLQIREGIASSVATGASLPLFINGVREPGNLISLKNKKANLYRRAKEAGYRTFWVSSEESKLVNNLGVQYIDHVLTQEDYPLDIAGEGDTAILDVLKQLPLGHKNFIIIMLRSVHGPYNDAYRRADNPAKYIRWPTKGVDNDMRMGNAYDNAIVFLDEWLNDSINWANTLPGDTLWMLTSDHGQELGKTDIWGHNVLTPAVAQVPMVLYQHHDNKDNTLWQLPTVHFLSHYQLTKWLLRRMGFVLHNPNEKPHKFFQQGFNLFGNNLYRRIIETPEGLVYCKHRFISNFYPGPDCPKGAAIHDFYSNWQAYL